MIAPSRFRIPRRRWGWTLFGCCLPLLFGCHLQRSSSQLPVSNQLVRAQLHINSNFRLPKRHRLIEELQAVGLDVRQDLALPESDEPIQVYLFDDNDDYRSFVKAQYPEFPDRRAIFVKDDTTLKVFAYWGERTGEDLRHEVTHGYLHSVIPNLPLWLDEGLAEYFEVGRGKHGLNRTHIALLAQEYRAGRWSPDLSRLEQLSNAAKLSQLEYAESWLWVHFLLESTPENRDRLQFQLARLRLSAEAEPLSRQFTDDVQTTNQKLLDHLRRVAAAIDGNSLDSQVGQTTP